MENNQFSIGFPRGFINFRARPVCTLHGFPPEALCILFLFTPQFRIPPGVSGTAESEVANPNWGGIPTLLHNWIGGWSRYCFLPGQPSNDVWKMDYRNAAPRENNSRWVFCFVLFSVLFFANFMVDNAGGSGGIHGVPDRTFVQI